MEGRLEGEFCYTDGPVEARYIGDLTFESPATFEMLTEALLAEGRTGSYELEACLGPEPGLYHDVLYRWLTESATLYRFDPSGTLVATAHYNFASSFCCNGDGLAGVSWRGPYVCVEDCVLACW